MKRLKFHDKGYKEWVRAEITAHDKLMEAGYRPQGMDMETGKIVIFEIKNENTNDEKRKFFYFNSWQEAVENLINGINLICLNCAKFKNRCDGTKEKIYTGCIYRESE